MRVLHVTESRSWSGGTVQLWNLCAGLVRRGHAAALFCPPESEILRHVPGTKVDVTLCPMRERLRSAGGLAFGENHSAVKPQVVHAHHPGLMRLLWWPAFLRGFPISSFPGGSLSALKKWNIFSQWKYRSKKIRTFIAVSEDIRRVLIEGAFLRKN